MIRAIAQLGDSQYSVSLTSPCWVRLAACAEST